MNSTKTKKWIAALLVAMLTVLGLGQTMVHAVENEEPLTDVIITKVETNDEAKDMTLEQLKDGVDVETYFTDGKVLPGVSFTWFSVTDAQRATMEAAPGDFDTVAEVEAVVGAGSGTATAETDVNGQVTIPNLPEGNYWVVENEKGTITSYRAVPFSLILPFTNLTGDGYLSEINVYPKNTLTDDEPDIEKTVDESNVAIGDINTWTVSLDIPVGIEDYDKFSFYDNIDSRLDFEGLSYVIAMADGINLIKGTDYTVAYADPRLDVVFTEAGRIKLKDADPKQVDVTIKTRVNDTAIMGQEIPNNATLEFNNGHGVDKERTPEIPPTVHTGGKAFKKMDGSSEALLEGAEFKVKGPNGNYVNVGANGVITFVAEGDATTFTSDVDGKFEVRGLPYGDYVLVETKAPQGYALPTDPETPFEVSKTSYHSEPEQLEVITDSDKPEYINNRKLVIPQTGGIGTAIFTIIGAVTMLASVLFYRRSNKA